MSKQNQQEKLKVSIYKKNVKECGDRLYKLRKAKNLEVKDLIIQLESEYCKNARTSISATQYRRLENGEHFMDTEVLTALCVFYSCTADFILFGKEEVGKDTITSLSKKMIENFCTQVNDTLNRIQENIIL